VARPARATPHADAPPGRTRISSHPAHGRACAVWAGWRWRRGYWGAIRTGCSSL